MTSIYKRALGRDFELLHPRIQQRFGFSSADGVGQVGRGVMEELWRGPAWTFPFLTLGGWRHIMFPAHGRDIAFTIENYAYVDGFGRETVTWVREFAMPRRSRRFDATMVYGEQRGRIVDYLGTHQHLAVDIELAVDAEGGLRLRSGEQRFHEGPVSFAFPMAISGIADVHEWWDEAEARYRIDVRVASARYGRLFGYRGWFEVEERRVGPGDIPPHVLPLREERRE
jgi:hypothetical protein